MGRSVNERAASAGRVLADRLAWRGRQSQGRVFEDPATMARTFTYLFGIGATLLLVTLPLPHSADRDVTGLVATALVAYAAGACALVVFDRLPLWAFEAAPFLGTVLVTFAIYFGGSDTPAAYAYYYFWVALAACYFFIPAIAATHLVLASAAYGLLLLLRPDTTQPALKWALATGTDGAYAKHGFGLWAVDSLESGETLGMCGLIRRDALEHPDLGFAFLERHRGKGYALESATVVLELARERFGFTKLFAITDPDNIASQKVLEKVGFRFDRKVDWVETGEVLMLYAQEFHA